MFMLSMLGWWYTRGWGDFVRRARERLVNLMDFFSIDLLVRTLFAPFRQISAEYSKNMPVDARVRAAFDKLFSRIMGAVVRILILIVGVICIVGWGLASLLMMVIWPALPLIPMAGIVLMAMGVVF